MCELLQVATLIGHKDNVMELRELERMEGAATLPHGLGAGGTCDREYVFNLCIQVEWFEAAGTSKEGKDDDSTKSDQ